MFRQRMCQFLSMAALCFASGGRGASGAENYLDAIQLVSQPVTIERGSTLNVAMPMLRLVDHVEIDAFGVGGEGMFEVVVGGQVKGTVHVPGQDPKYIVTIADSTRSFNLVHASGQRIRISSFKVFFASVGGETHIPPSHQDAAIVCRDIINKMSQFQSHISANDFQDHILPIKVAAGHCYAIATASGDLSKRLAEAIGVLQIQFHDAKGYFDASMAHDELFDLSVQALELMYKLDDMIN
jgi:hypothetical protein